ncbi:MAG: undecaprenyl/decaprenyl-phosphate alpha-N-acetylglucosaminyl 1-phosphate transferase [Deltaproteobacteria bacterium]|nr:undecaprenyl/decaprenyl-phosphate alpha-N-acetylglucosaminyl 1-phosphate transferase [Deltaproteobacteria bacterium]
MIYKIIVQTIIGILLIVLIQPIVKMAFFNAGLRWQYIFAFSFLTTCFITPLCRFAAIRFNILDKPDWRKIHDQATPLLGGVAVYIAFTAAILLNNIFLHGMMFLLIGASLIFLIGLWDDIRPVPAILKFILQILISLFVIISGDIQLTFFYQSSWAPLMNIPLTVIWIVGLTNALNFFDGVDGLATTLTIIASLFLGMIAFKTNQPALGWLTVALMGACIGFMPFNFRFGRSALLFLGDAGSTFLGFTLAGLAVLGTWSNTSHFVSLTAPVLIFGVMIFDMIYVNLSRIKNRQAKNFVELLTCVNKDHLHHRLIFMGFARKEAVYIIAIISTCLGVSALIIMNQRFIEAALGLFQAVLILGLVAVFMLKGREKIPKEGDRRIWRRRREDR